MGKIRSGEPRGPVSLVNNLKLVVNASVNRLDIFSRSGGAAPDASNPISVAIPDGNGNVFRQRAGAYLSGTSQFIMADAANYWSKGSLDAEIKTAYVYAIWDGTGIVWALAGYSGFTRVPASTTATDDDFFLLEEGSTYTKAVTEYCVCVGKIRYQYDTGDAPDHTIQSTVLDAPQILWNPKSDYGYTKTLATTVTAADNLALASRIAVVVKQSGKYNTDAQTLVASDGTAIIPLLDIRVGATYSSATVISYISGRISADGTPAISVKTSRSIWLNAGDTLSLGAGVTRASGGTNTYIRGDNEYTGATALTFGRVD